MVHSCAASLITDYSKSTANIIALFALPISFRATIMLYPLVLSSAGNIAAPFSPPGVCMKHVITFKVVQAEHLRNCAINTIIVLFVDNIAWS